MQGATAVDYVNIQYNNYGSLGKLSDTPPTPSVPTPPLTGSRGKKGKTHSKKTVPKPSKSEDQGTFSSFHTPPESPEDMICNHDNLQSPSLLSEFDEDMDDEEDEMQDYRRFSQRMRHKTAFFGVNDLVSSPCRGDLRSHGRRRKLASSGAKRMLNFNEQLLIKPVSVLPKVCMKTLVKKKCSPTF